MSKEQTSSPVVQSREQELEAKLRLIKRRSRTHRVGNLVLLTNKNNEDKSNAHGGIVLDQEFLIEIMRDFGFSDDVLNRISQICAEDIDIEEQVQLDFSMVESNKMAHDPHMDGDDPDVKTAPTFWVDQSSQFCVETHRQHVQRDADSGFSMLDGGNEYVSGGAQRKTANKQFKCTGYALRCVPFVSEPKYKQQTEFMEETWVS